MKTNDSITYTVRPLGCTAWEEGIKTLARARASAARARSAGLAQVVVVDDETGQIVEEERDALIELRDEIHDAR